VTKTVPADGSVAVTVNGNGADDTVNLSAASIAGATVNGDDGDDIIVGSAKVDSIHGDAGNDRLTGFHGSETIAGDDGNDVMIWNNGDGKDVDEGGAGLDETLITTGAAADQMKVSPLAGGRTFFERTNAPFTVDMGTVERLTVTSFSGDDKLETAPGVTLPMTIDAGPGADDITTGDAGDRIVGDRGNDSLHGGAGDDTLVWNNGDGTDDMNGDDGLDRVEPNLSGADDISQVKVQDGKVRYDRLNTPFGLNIASSEVLALNTLGGNDTLDVGPGVGALIAITADGGAGNDRLNGGDEADTFFGGLGDDTLEPGAGADTVDGQDGNDTLRVRDGAGDLARGGAGTDSAQADAADVLADVENADVERPAAPDTTATRLQVVFRKISSKLKRGVYTARVRVHCPASEPGGCRGTLSLLTAKPVRIGGVKVQALLASKSYALKTNEFRTLKLKLPKGVRKLSHKGTLSLRVQTVSRDAAGNVATGASKLTVKLVKKAR
jgi:Ca2+-binding RTX toxin-like protein